jgi:hypothetical protein
MSDRKSISTGDDCLNMARQGDCIDLRGAFECETSSCDKHHLVSRREPLGREGGRVRGQGTEHLGKTVFQKVMISNSF